VKVSEKLWKCFKNDTDIEAHQSLRLLNVNIADLTWLEHHSQWADYFILCRLWREPSDDCRRLKCFVTVYCCYWDSDDWRFLLTCMTATQYSEIMTDRRSRSQIKQRCNRSKRLPRESQFFPGRRLICTRTLGRKNTAETAAAAAAAA